MRGLLYAAAVLVFLAGLQLYLLTTETATYFAWTVLPPITAAFLGAAYWAAVPLELIAARRNSWAEARAVVPGVWLFTTLTLIATLLHFGRFHFSSSDPIPRAAAYLWLAIYASVPVGFLIAGYLQFRTRGSDPERGIGLSGGLRLALFAVGAGMVVVGAALFIDPVAAAPAWPWSLTPLTAQAIGSWFLGTGLATFLSVREGELARMRPLGGGFTVFAVFELGALARFPAEIAWRSGTTWLYVAFVVALLALGPILWFGDGRHRPRAIGT
jgi:hypothetical protein